MSDQFPESCGLSSPLRLVVEGPDGHPEGLRELRAPFAVVGRDPASDVMLDHPDVSRRHAYLQVIDGRVFALDLGSRAGLSWGGEPRQSGWVGGGEGLRVGAFALRPEVEASGTQATLPTSRKFQIEGAAELTLDIPGNDAEPGRRAWRASRVLVLLGQSVSCRVRLTGPGIAAVHAAIVRTPGGAWIVDLLAPGGVTVNGTRVRSARLATGDEVLVGPERIGVRCGPIAPEDATSELVRRTPMDQIANRSQVADPVLASVFEEFGRMQEQMAGQFQQALMTMFRMFSGMHGDQMALIREELARLHELTEEQKSLQARVQGPMPGRDRPTLTLVAPSPLTVSSPPPASPDVAASARPAPAVGPPAPDSDLWLMQRLTEIGDERQGRWQKLLNSVLGKAGERTAP